MLSLPSNVRVFLCTRPTDMRKSFDGLMGQVSEVFQNDPLSGHLFLFVNRRRDKMKVLFWDQDGLCIWYKRLEAGTWQLPSVEASGVELDRDQLAMILRGIDLTTVRKRRRYQRLGRSDVSSRLKSAVSSGMMSFNE
jgi:transposase